ncbi:MAG: DUF502 domain-containing protein [Phycisphaerae bacterium]
MADTFISDFKRFFLRGLAAVLPTVVTLAIIVWIFSKIQDYAGRYINIGVMSMIAWIQAGSSGAEDTNLAWRRAYDDIHTIWNSYYLWWIGFLLAIVGIYIFGRFVGSYVGRGVWRLTESALLKTPIIKLIYPHIKQVTDFLLSERQVEFSGVVAVEYPRKGIWSVGLLTSKGMRTIREHAGEDLVTVFIPSSPTPVTGYTITVKRKDAIVLPLTIDEALKFTISGGVIMPLNQLADGKGSGDARRRIEASESKTQKE